MSFVLYSIKISTSLFAFASPRAKEPKIAALFDRPEIQKLVKENSAEGNSPIAEFLIEVKNDLLAEMVKGIGRGELIKIVKVMHRYGMLEYLNFDETFRFRKILGHADLDFCRIALWR